jgi:geranylgeranyl diphosphate synthase, type I
VASDTHRGPALTAAVRPAAEPGVDIAVLLEATLTRFLDTATESLLALDDELRPLARAVRDAVTGGKRLRPTFSYWAWRGVVGDGAPLRPVLPALAALELLHAFALVHDDVMDGSATRRGRPTTHRALAAAHADRRLRGDPERFGQAAAILVGDLCLVWADQMIAAARWAGVPGERLLAARGQYDRMRVEAIAGQFLDVVSESSENWSVERAMRTVRLKTAAYTVVRPLAFGAALGRPVLQAVRDGYTRYGLAVGEAFQLRDDLLDVYGDPAVTGKPVGQDLAAGKRTVLLELARRRATRRQAGQLRRLLASGTEADVGRLAALIGETGATAQVRKMISQRVTEAVAALERTPIDRRARSALTDLAATAAWRLT